jgi:hypothetical protein
MGGIMAVVLDCGEPGVKNGWKAPLLNQLLYSVMDRMQFALLV